MVDKNNADEPSSSDRPNRRKFLQLIGAGAFGAAGLGGISSVSQGATTGSDLEIDKLTGSEKARTVATARRTDDFKRLRTHFRKEYDATVNRTFAFEIAGDSPVGSDEAYTLVRFVLDGNPQKDSEQTIDQRNIEIIVALQNGEAVASKGGVIEEHNDEQAVKATAVQQKGGSIETETTEVDLSEYLVENDVITPQHYFGECEVCIAVVNFVCEHGCGLGSIAMCFILFGPGAGILCSTTAHFVCKEIDRRTDCRRRSARNLCRYYGYC